MRARRAFGLLLVLVAASSVRGQTPSADLDSYALFALNELRSRALVVTDGNVGVNAGGGQFYSAWGVHAPLSDLAASRVRIPISECRTLFANVTPLRQCGSGPPRRFTSPFVNATAVTEACGFPTSFPACAGADLTIEPAQVFRLKPGQYRNILVRGGVLPGRLILLGGDYSFCSLKATRNADVLFDSASQVFIDGDLDLGGIGFAGTGGEDVGARKIRFFVRGSKVRIRPRARVFGRLCAPNATMKVRYGAKLFGSFVARSIRTDRITVRALPAGVPGTSTTTTTTTLPVTTSTTTTTTTSTTRPAAVCGNDRIDPGEACDPPGGVVCPSPGGAFTACAQNCLCPHPVDTRCCFPPSPAGGFVDCELLKPAECAREGGVLFGLGSCDPSPCAGISFPPTTSTTATTTPTTTSTTPTTSTTTTRPSTTTTTSPKPATTTTTTGTGATTTTSTTPGGPIAPAREVCGNCADDDGNGDTDFEDAACCAGTQKFEMAVRNGRIRPRGSTSALKLQSTLGGVTGIDPLRQDVYVQIRSAEGKQLFCAHVPATEFTRRRGTFAFWDRQHLVASAMGLEDMSVKVRRNGRVTFRTHGRRARLSGVTQGVLRITVGFRDAAQVESANRCSQVQQRFRTVSAGALLAP